MSHGAWFVEQMARWKLIDERTDRAALVARVYRPDIYRAALSSSGIPLPLADTKPEGAHEAAWMMEASPAPIPMGPDRFCDGAVFTASDRVSAQ
jgi:NitT/TauT family transport system ATP-binding protein/nitrate/nitrite transport system substrate-binding protein